MAEMAPRVMLRKEIRRNLPGQQMPSKPNLQKLYKLRLN